MFVTAENGNWEGFESVRTRSWLCMDSMSKQGWIMKYKIRESSYMTTQWWKMCNKEGNSTGCSARCQPTSPPNSTLFVFPSIHLHAYLPTTGLQLLFWGRPSGISLLLARTSTRRSMFTLACMIPLPVMLMCSCPHSDSEVIHHHIIPGWAQPCCRLTYLLNHFRICLAHFHHAYEQGHRSVRGIVLQAVDIIHLYGRV